MTLLPVLDDEERFRDAHAADPALEVLVALWSGRAEDAEALVHADALHRDSLRWRALLADCWRDQGRTAEAVVAYRGLVGQAAGTSVEAVVRQHLGKALFVARRYEEAAVEFEEALRLRVAAGADDSLVASSELALARARACAAERPALVLPQPPPAYGDVRLRGLTPQDVPLLRELSTDPYVPLTGTLPGDADELQALAYVERQHERLATGAGYPFCVAAQDSGAGLGLAGLWVGGRASGTAEVGYAVAPSARGRGVARQALTALAGVAWASGLGRLEAYVEPWNTASLRAAAAAGFVREAVLPSHRVVGGRAVDMVLLSRGRG